jgi:hypothetical protein
MADAIAQVAQETSTPPVVLSLCEWGWVSGHAVILVALGRIIHLQIQRIKFGYGGSVLARAGG